MSSTAPLPETNAQAESLRVLVIEDNPLDAELTLRALRQSGFEVAAIVVQSVLRRGWHRGSE